MQTAIGPIIPIGTVCDCQSASGKQKPCTVEDYEIHNNRLFHKVKHMLPNGEFFGGGIVEGRRLIPKELD